MPLNYFVVYPAYVVCYHLPLEAIIGMYQAIRPSTNGLLECLMVFNMPFTFVKGMIDVALCFLIYKPLSRCCTNNIRKELHVHGARLGHSSLDPEQHLLPVSRRRGPKAHDARQRRHHLDPRRRSPAVHKKYRRQGALVLVGLLAGLLVGNVALKHLVARSRPCWLDPSVQLLIATPTDYSFPSGHTLSSTIAATILTKTDRRFGYVAIPLAVLIALSRLYLYVHFPSDVFAAALLGLLIGELTFRYGGKLLDKISRRQKQ